MRDCRHCSAVHCDPRLDRCFHQIEAKLKSEIRTHGFFEAPKTVVGACFFGHVAEDGDELVLLSDGSGWKSSHHSTSPTQTASTGKA